MLHTSLLVTGLSISTKWVSLGNVDNTSRSASSAMLFDASTKVARLGIDCTRVGCMLEIRFRARRRLCNRGEKGKFPRTCISLSVKSMASSGYMMSSQVSNCTQMCERIRVRGVVTVKPESTHAGNAQVLNCWYFVSCILNFDINSARLKV
jgi:hypothetical protein